MSFISDEFIQSSSNAGSYFKPKKGVNNKVRILSERAMEGYVQWTQDSKPMRWKYGENKPEANYQADTRPRKFLATAVWNYDAEQVQVWEITQKSIMDSINEIARDPDFGHPNGYDLKITRTGEGLETQYQIIPHSAALLPEVEAAMQNPGVNLEALLHGEDPFA
jgi:hypothetical protein